MVTDSMTDRATNWQLIPASGLRSLAPSAAYWPGLAQASPDGPVSQQLLSWLLFWPVLTLIARQAVYFAGPPATAAVGQYGASMGGAQGSHVFLYGDMLMLFCFVATSYRQVLLVLKRNWLIPVMLALAAYSAVWSMSPFATLVGAAKTALCTLFACYLGSRFTTERLMQFLIFMGVISAVLSVVFVFALPGFGVFQGDANEAWQGICAHKNSLGISMAFLLSPIFFVSSYSRERKLAYGALLLFLIYKSQSRGAWADTGGMLLFVGWLYLIRRLRHRELALIVLLSGILITAMVALGIHYWPVLATSMGKDPTMTGRTGIYTEVWHSILKQPYFGYGYGGFWWPGSFESQRICLAIGWPNIGYSENGFLEVALQIGLVGAGLVVAFIAKALVQGISSLRSERYSPAVGWFLTILCLAALTNIDAGWFLTSDTLDWVLIVISCVGINQAMDRKLRAAATTGTLQPLRA